MPKPARLFGAVAAILCVQAVLGIAYLQRVATFNAPDEPAHLRYIERLSEGELPRREADRWSYKGAEPPLYYALAVPFAAPLEGRSARARVAALRFLNVLLGLATTLCVYLLGVRVAGERSAAYAAAFSALLPQHVFVSSTLGNDELAAALSTAALWLGARHLYKRPRAWLGPAVGVALGLALLARASALAVAAAYALCALDQGRRDERGAARLVLLPLGVAAALSGWFYARSLGLYGSAFGWPPAGTFSGLEAAQPAWLGAFAQGTVGLFGWSNAPLPPGVYAAAFAALAAGLAGFAAWARSERPWRLEPSWKLALAAAAACCGFAALEVLATRQPQGRLLLPGIGPLALVVVCGWRALSWSAGPRTRPLLRRAAFAGAIALQYFALRAL